MASFPCNRIGTSWSADDGEVPMAPPIDARPKTHKSENTTVWTNSPRHGLGQTISGWSSAIQA